MEKGFTKKQLERIGCSNEEIQLVLDYQKRLPVLVNNEDMEGFCVNTRQLHEQLGVGKTYQHWIKARIKSYRFTENVDFISLCLNGHKPKGGRPDTTFMCTIDMAEDLAMVERTDIGETVRNYFKLMRDIVKRNVKWEEVRCYERTHYKPMCDALSNFIQRNTGRSGDGYDFALEANRLNIIATGNRAQSLKNYFGIQTNELTRDSLEKEYNEGIYEPLSIVQAVETCKQLVRMFTDKKIEVIRVGLQNTDEICNPDNKESEVVAGPFHPAFGQLVESSMWYDAIVEKIKKLNVKVKEVEVTVNPIDTNNVIGHKKENVIKLKDTYEVDLIVKQDEKIKQGKSKIEVTKTYNDFLEENKE